MKFRFLTIAALSLLASQGARADIIFNSNVTQPPAGADGLYDGGAALAISFTTSAVPNLATLVLSAANPGDGGSAMIYLVADNGAGAGPGQAGDPTYTSTGATFNGFTNDVLIGTLADSSLSTTPKSYNFSITPSEWSTVSALTAHNEYWIGLSDAGSSVEWSYDDATSDGIGYAGQSSFAFVEQYSPPGTSYPILPLVDGFGPYQLTIQAPEPISLSIMGVGLIGLGVARRRGVKKT